MPPETSLLVFMMLVVFIFALAWISRHIGFAIQENVYYLTGSGDMAMVILFLVYLPGIVVHEGAHWLMAKILGMRTGAFRVWPRKQGKHIGMGSVTVASGGTLADSLVGLAPLLLGSILVAWIGTRIFGAQSLGAAWRQGDWWQGVADVFQAIVTRDDGLVWGYLIFAIANAMMPSSSDRQPLKSLLLYLSLVGILYFFFDQSGRLLIRVADWLTQPVQVLVSALLFTLLLDIVILFFLYGTQAFIRFFRHAR